ncbi:cell wall protein RBR3-like [Chenopodium quinoa]|uniref:cell wall protein RBR3-like n=1 Tax=Chenopodium quinoa TaxID=63459 RepID=UPI000B792835|nr:cell wall protein RBR3-like [Chenopodium quinoa]
MKLLMRNSLLISIALVSIGVRWGCYVDTLFVYNIHCVQKIPEQYIVKRWTKKAMCSHVSDEETCEDVKVVPSAVWRVQMVRKYVQLVTSCQEDLLARNEVEYTFQMLREKVESVMGPIHVDDVEVGEEAKEEGDEEGFINNSKIARKKGERNYRPKSTVEKACHKAKSWKKKVDKYKDEARATVQKLVVEVLDDDGDPLVYTHPTTQGPNLSVLSKKKNVQSKNSKATTNASHSSSANVFGDGFRTGSQASNGKGFKNSNPSTKSTQQFSANVFEGESSNNFPSSNSSQPSSSKASNTFSTNNVQPSSRNMSRSTPSPFSNVFGHQASTNSSHASSSKASNFFPTTKPPLSNVFGFQASTNFPASVAQSSSRNVFEGQLSNNFPGPNSSQPSASKASKTIPRTNAQPSSVCGCQAKNTKSFSRATQPSLSNVHGHQASTNFPATGSQSSAKIVSSVSQAKKRKVSEVNHNRSFRYETSKWAQYFDAGRNARNEGSRASGYSNVSNYDAMLSMFDKTSNS